MQCVVEAGMKFAQSRRANDLLNKMHSVALEMIQTITSQNS